MKDELTEPGEHCEDVALGLMDKSARDSGKGGNRRTAVELVELRMLWTRLAEISSSWS
jgi:hypothetical protein